MCGESSPMYELSMWKRQNRADHAGQAGRRDLGGGGGRWGGGSSFYISINSLISQQGPLPPPHEVTITGTGYRDRLHGQVTGTGDRDRLQGQVTGTG